MRKNVVVAVDSGIDWLVSRGLSATDGSRVIWKGAAA
jgi:hypothetical protein